MSWNDANTDELLRRAAEGDGSAVGMLLDRHRPRLRRMVQVRMVPELHVRIDPSDVVQETLAEASQNLKDYLNRPPLPFYPWLRQIAWQRLARLYDFHCRAAKRTLHREAKWALSDASSTSLCHELMASLPSPSSILLAAERQDHMRRLLDQLSEADREILVLRYLEQLTTNEIAAVLVIGESAVKMRQLRALDHLRTLWNNDNQGE